MSRYRDPFDDVPATANHNPAATRSVSPGSVSPRLRPQRIAESLYKAVSSNVEHQQAKQNSNRCSAANPFGGVNSSAASRPRFLMCYLCGQQFGSASLGIHQPQCYVKKLIEWERADPVRRGQRPIHPEQMAAMTAEQQQEMQVSRGNGNSVEAFNEAQFKTFTEKMLVACENCGRTFLPDRLVVHQRSCKAGNAAKPVRRAISPLPHQTLSASLRGHNTSLPIEETVEDYHQHHSSSRVAPRGGATQPSTTTTTTTTISNNNNNLNHHNSSYGDEGHVSQLPRSHNDAQDDAADEGYESVEREDHLDGTRVMRDSITMIGSASPQRQEGRLGSSVQRKALPVSPQRESYALPPSNSGDSPIAQRPSNGGRVATALRQDQMVPLRTSVSQSADLVRCQYCNRTFTQNRVERHEDACQERKHPTNKRPSAGRSSQPSTAPEDPRPRTPPPPANIVQKKRPTETRVSNPVVSAAPPAATFHSSLSGGNATAAPPVVSAVKFCTECGAKRLTETQKFCGECGHRY